jgi:PAS domain S-box-containing protein
VASIRILIVDDHDAVRHGLRSLLSSRSDWAICGEAVDGIEAVEKTKSLQPDIVLMDITMPRMDGLEATRNILKESLQCKVVIITQNDPAVARNQAATVGARAFVTKSQLSQDLVTTVERVAKNGDSDLEALVPGNAVAIGDELTRGGGVVGQLVREFDWAKTPLGPINTWPQSLKTVVRVLLTSRFAMWMGWGTDLTFFYNDAYQRMTLGKKHPWALGRPSREVWAEIWDDIGPRIRRVLESGEATWDEALLLFLERSGYREETYHTFSYSPLSGDDGRVAGHLCVVSEETDRVIGERRLKTLRSLAAELNETITEEQVCASIVRSLSENQKDLPFSLTYLFSRDGKQAHLACQTGIKEGHAAAASPISVTTGDQLWPVGEIFKKKSSVIVEELSERFNSVPCGFWNEPPAKALLVPITSQGQDNPAGFLVAALNPYRPLDAHYEGFLNLVAGQIAASIANARAYDQERKRGQALEEIDRAKTLFFSNVSHELRTPLTLMLGPVEDLLANSHIGLSPAAKSQLELVNRNGSRLLRLVNTLLDFSRIEAGRMQATYQPTDLAAFTVELASVFRSATEKAGLRLELDCPALDEPVFVDRDMWEKIVLNLLSNAFKFTFKGRIAVALTKAGTRVELRIRDTGVGIPADEIPRLFDRFHRVENTRSRTHEGSGIGLALVRELVKLHGGYVRVGSVLGEGSTFTVGIPLGSAHLSSDRLGESRALASTAVGAAPFVEEALRWIPDAACDTTTQETLPGDELMALPCPPLSQNHAASTRRPRILVADDNADMRQYLGRLLGERYEVEAAPDGRVALDSIRERRPELVLTDVMMPNLDGFGLLRELRADPRTRTIPIILLSARAGEESRVEGMEHGADDYLIKPFSARELLARVQTHLEMARVRKQAEDDLRQRTAQFEILLHAAPLGVYLVDADLKILHMNPTALQAFGDIPNLIGRDFAEVIHILWPNSYADEIFEHFRHTLETGDPYIVPERIENRADRGVAEIYEWQINRIPLPDGRFGVVCYFRDISRLVYAREAIAESKERLRLATEAAKLGIWHWYLDKDQITWENDRAHEILGRAREDGTITAAEFRAKVIHPEDSQAFEHAVSTMLESGAPFFFQGRVSRKDGSSAWVELTGRLERRADRSPWRVLGTVLDITQRKQAEQTNSLLAAIVDSSDDAIISKSLDGVITSWNQSAERLFGYKAEEAIGRSMGLIVPPDRQNEEATILDNIRRGQRIEHFETIRVRKDGTQVAVSLTISPVKNHSGLVVGASKTARDITERKRAELALRESEERFRAIVETTPECVKLVTSEGILLHMNSSGLKMVGATCAELVVGTNVYDLIAAEDRDRFRTFNERICRGEKGCLEFGVVGLQGEARHMETHAAPFRMPDGTVVQLGVTRDITERTRAGEALRRSEERFRDLSETLEAEVQVRTSELEQRNADILKHSEQVRDLSWRLMRTQDDERRHIARELHDSAGQTLTVLGMNVARLVTDIKQGAPELAKHVEETQYLVQHLNQEIRTTSYLLHPPMLDESGLSAALDLYVRGLAERSGLGVNLSISEQFGRLPPDMELTVFRIVQECLTNIHRHSGSKIAGIRVVRQPDSISVEVRDQGKGMPAERLAEIQLEGSGVGIRGIRERLRQFKGQMTIESDCSGTRILVSIPIPKNMTFTERTTIEPLQAEG